MGQNVPLCDSPYSLPHLLVARLLCEVLRYVAQKIFITTQHGIGKNSKLTSLFHRIEQLSITMVG
mgnify:CR=1 FL=1